MKCMNVRMVVAFGLLAASTFAVSNLPLPAEIFDVNGRRAFVMQPGKASGGKSVGLVCADLA